MTPDDLELDPEFFLERDPLLLYRLARTRFADLSGIGSARFPGRWNRFGEEALYTSTHRSTTLLERLAHSSKELIPVNLSMMKIRLSGSWLLGPGDILTNDQDDARIRIFRTLKSAKASFNSRSHRGLLAIAVPSVIDPAWNVVLYPGSPFFWDHVSLPAEEPFGIEPFSFDPRLFPDNTPMEDAG